MSGIVVSYNTTLIVGQTGHFTRDCIIWNKDDFLVDMAPKYIEVEFKLSFYLNSFSKVHTFMNYVQLGLFCNESCSGLP